MSKKLSYKLFFIVACSTLFFTAIFASDYIAYAEDTTFSLSDSYAFNEQDFDDVSLQSSASQKGATTDVQLGGGIIGTRKFSIDQKSVASTSLSRLKHWREDALNDSNIKISGKTISDYLKQIGMSESDYKNPKWSNTLERIALQRSIEAGDLSLGHTRPNGDSCFTATYDGKGASAESLAWASYNITGENAIDMWAVEKADYVKQVNGQDHGETGHYLMMIDPSYKSYGFAVTDGFSTQKVAAGEASTQVLGSTSPTNLAGTYSFDISVSQSLVEKHKIALNLYSGATIINLNDSFTFSAVLNYRNGTFAVKEKWYSDNSSVLKMETSGKATALSSGTAKVYIIGKGNSTVFIDITVPEKNAMFRLYNKWTGEHFYTKSATELNNLVLVGWTYENVGWYAPQTSKTPVYRLYNPYAGDHHYTTNKSEYDKLAKVGWRQEGTGWYSSAKTDSGSTALLRQYNPYAEVGTHNFTLNQSEKKNLISKGWRDEGIGWYGFKNDQ